ncbi:MAG: PP2C family protein-serine/threonine phosphatase [Planctomycetes bacterium]|nr:PP2C family protein-serine/threonine phosphatase [Planctomycetota bacterium]
MASFYENPDSFARLRHIANSLGGAERKTELFVAISTVLDPLFPGVEYSILTHDPVNESFLLEYASHLPGPLPQVIGDPGPLAGVFRSGTPLRPGSTVALSLNGGPLPVLTADPLVHRSQPVGLLLIHRYSESEAGDPARFEWLPLIAEQAAARLTLLDLYAETEIAAETGKTKLEVLHEVAQLLTQLDLDVLLTKILELSLHIVNAEVGSLMLWEGNALVSKVEWGLTDAVVGAIRRKDGPALAEQVSREGQVCYLPHLRDEPGLDLAELHAGVNSFLCLPLTTKEKPLGVINIVNAEASREVTEQDLDVLQTMTDLAAIAVENAILYRNSLERERMAEQLKIASQIQKSLLPDRAPKMRGLEISGWSAPCDETGGDYYDFLGTLETSLGLVIGDVSGHGIASALLMATARAFLRAMIDTTQDLSLLFRMLNNMLERDMEDDRFMTMFLCILDPDAARMSYVSAGHDAPLLYRTAEDRFQELESTGPPLGMFPDLDFETVQVNGLKVGDVLLFSTDGVWEAMNLNGDSWGRERLMEAVRRNHLKKASEIIEAIDNEVREFCAGAPQHDDITLVVTKISSPLDHARSPDTARIRMPSPTPR